MSFMDGVWIYGEIPRISRRWTSQHVFVGTFSNDGKTIDGRHGICQDGTTWEDDLQIACQRTTGPSSS